MKAELAALEWYLDAGVDEAIAEMPWNRMAVAAPPPPASSPVSATTARAVAPPPSALPRASVSTNALATPLAGDFDGIADLAALRTKLDAFDGCALKATAMNTVFGVGPADADLMIVGEAPGEEEDRKGEPFVGPSGQLLDRMLAAIGLARAGVYITNTIYWRPPGNRTPTPHEVLACQPFLQRQIALIAPKVLLLVGGAAAKTVLGRPEGIMRLRGRWFEVDTAGGGGPIPAMATFHPAYLLRSPAQKREAWQDLQAVQERLESGKS